jgi:3-oxoacyl-[acyl-carrier protein] reductase
MAAQIRANGRCVEIGQDDRLGPSRRQLAGRRHVRREGRIDASFDPLSNDDVQGTMLSDLNVDEFVQPVEKALGSRLATTSALAVHVWAPRSGVVLTDAGSSPSSVAACRGGQDPSVRS